MKKQGKQLDLIRKVYNAGLQLLSPTSTQDLYPCIASTLKSLIGSSYISLYRVQNDELVKVYTSTEQLKNVYPRKDGFTYKAFEKSVPYLINKDVLTIHPELKQMGVKTTLIIPLIFQNEPLGVLSVDFQKEKKFSHGVMESLQLFASIVTFKLQNLDLQIRLQEVAENQKMFISMASHELKNPLTTVLGYASIILKEIKKGKSVEVKVPEVLVSEIHRMSELIDELLNIKNSNLEKGKLKYKKTNYSIKKLLSNTLTNWHISFPTRKLIINNGLSDEVLIYLDSQKVKQVVINLLNNAAKFSKEGQPIMVESFTQDQHVVLRIIDTGQGIADSDLKHIFKRFYKGNHGRKKDGVGLGLYLCKQIIEDHQGTICAQSKLGKGTTFEIKLPIYVV